METEDFGQKYCDICPCQLQECSRYLSGLSPRESSTALIPNILPIKDEQCTANTPVPAQVPKRFREENVVLQDL